jgi:hypothetical protein
MSPDDDLNKQINHKFIRPVYKPFDGTPLGFQKKIDMDPNGLPTYKIERTNENSIDPPKKDLETTMIVDLPPPLNYTPQNFSNPVEPEPSHKHHNCCELYHEVQSCPVCKNIYNKNDGIYITVIVILLVIILFLLKKIFI